MIPVLNILGRPNVGKSSLFNNLTKNKFSIVSNIENYTINRNYKISYINKYKYLIIDNKGINKFFVKDNYFKYLFLDDCDIILFLTDSINNYDDKLILNNIIKKKLYIFYIINKIDNNKFFLYKTNFFLKPFFISTSHNYNINNTIHKIIKIFCLNNFCEKIKNFKKFINICLIGKKNSGKSSYLNFLLNENRISINNLDNVLIKFKYKKFFINFYDNYFSNKNKNLKLKQNLLKSNIILLFINCIDFNKKDILIIKFLFKKYLNFFVILNKIDLLNLKEKIKFKIFFKKNFKIKNNYILLNSNLIKNNFIKIFYKIYLKSLKNLNVKKFFLFKNFINKKFNKIFKIKKIIQVSKNPYIINLYCFYFKKFIKKTFIKFNESFFYKFFKIKSIYLKINYLKF